MRGDFSRWTFQPAKHYHSVLKQQGRVDVDADWNEQGAIAAHRVETETLDVVGQSGAPAANAGFLITPDTAGKTLLISAGRAYVDGILCENEQTGLAVTDQPDFPGFALPTAPGVYIAYLNVWLRHVIALDDPRIREDALGGPDTCSRSRTIWQVGLLQPEVKGNINCSTNPPEWAALTAPGTGTLAARAQPDPTATDPCMIPAKAGYRSLENQLYRVEIHAGGSNGQATFKWSRDNGSVVTAWTAGTATDLTVTSTGRDSVLGFGPGQWVELTDDSHELNFQPGTLAQIKTVQNNVISIEKPTGPTAIATFPVNPRIRRWDGVSAAPVAPGSWINLEDGVQVQFSGGSYSTGDYWMIPARTLKADVEWLQDGSGDPLPQAPRGIERHFCKLAVLAFNGSQWSVTSTCLPIFPPLTTLNPAGANEAGIHITAVRFLRSNLNLLNDSDVPLAMLAEGIGVVCDAPVAPVSIKRPTCFVSVELPFPLTAAGAVGTNPTTGAPAAGVISVLGFQPLILLASTGFNTTSLTVEWKVGAAEILAYLQDILLRLQATGQDPRLLAHLTLKGNFIWGPNDRLAQMYLDGEGYATPRLDDPNSGTSIRTGLKIPKSGDGGRGGDFESWFWLTLPVRLVSLTFAPNPVASGNAAVGTLTLSAPAPQGGAVVALVPNNSKLATVPATATIPAGATVGTFPVTAVSSSVAISTLQVTGSYQQSTATGVLSITGAPPR